jgi:hydrogenase expression/formation protein HypC
MCVAEPAAVLEVDDGMALVELRGVARTVPLTVLMSTGEIVVPGDFVLVHTGLAVARLTHQEAADRISFLHQGADDEGS